MAATAQPIRHAAAAAGGGGFAREVRLLPTRVSVWTSTPPSPTPHLANGKRIARNISLTIFQLNHLLLLGTSLHGGPNNFVCVKVSPGTAVNTVHLVHCELARGQVLTAKVEALLAEATHHRLDAEGLLLDC